MNTSQAYRNVLQGCSLYQIVLSMFSSVMVHQRSRIGNEKRHNLVLQAELQQVTELQITMHTVYIFCDIYFNLNRILWCDHSLESSCKDGNNIGLSWEIRKLVFDKMDDRLEDQ